MAVSVAPTAAPPASSEATSSGFRRILLASEGRPIPDSAIAAVARLAAAKGAHVEVLTVARIYGTAFGMTTPGLLPTKSEWVAQHEIAAAAVKRLRRRGLAAEGNVVGTRSATKRICAEAKAKECEAIVMAADADRNRLMGDMMWTQEPQRVRRRARIPVFLVSDDL